MTLTEIEKNIRRFKVTEAQYKRTPRNNRAWMRVRRDVNFIAKEIPNDGMLLHSFIRLGKYLKRTPFLTINDVVSVAYPCNVTIEGDPFASDIEPARASIRRGRADHA